MISYFYNTILKKRFIISFLLLVFVATAKTQTYYSGKITSISSSFLKLSKRNRAQKQKRKIYVKQTIDSSFITIDVVIKNSNKKTKTTRTYQRFILGKHYPDFRLFIKNRTDEKILYIKSGEGYDIDLYDGILRSLLPDYEFFHEKTHRVFFKDKFENRYNIAFDIIKEKDKSLFKHKLQFEKSLEMINFYYSASGIANSKQKIEMIKIESIAWNGPSGSPFKQTNDWIELAQVRKKRKLRKIRKLFRKR